MKERALLEDLLYNTLGPKGTWTCLPFKANNLIQKRGQNTGNKIKKIGLMTETRNIRGVLRRRTY